MTHSNFAKLLECTLFLLVCSCNGQKGARSIEEIAEEIVIAQPDTSIYAYLKGNKGDSLLFQLDMSEEMIAVDCDRAMQNQSFMGDVCDGNKYAIVMEPDTRQALSVLNLTELSGQWFYNEAENRGFTFTTAGALSSINPKTFCFKKWKFHNGRLILYYINREEVVKDSRQFHTDTTQIEKLSAEELVFRFQNETLHCVRKKEAIKVKLKF